MHKIIFTIDFIGNESLINSQQDDQKLKKSRHVQSTNKMHKKVYGGGNL